LAITLVLQVIFVPRIGYWASCGSSLVCYFVIMLLSYFIGRKRLQVPYDMKRIAMYTVLIAVLLGIFALTPYPNVGLKMLFGTLLIAIYLFVFYKWDLRSLLKK
ncbi:MAG: polysaccharide biosynthesis C-terminal domain-containing protein, partial [Paludibacteraceae bacterium]|nr:polysaccharide biosynthesis C-terminal domain-containing protein [Paludibacteraceae bacterium]